MVCVTLSGCGVGREHPNSVSCIWPWTPGACSQQPWEAGKCYCLHSTGRERRQRERLRSQPREVFRHPVTSVGIRHSNAFEALGLSDMPNVIWEVCGLVWTPIRVLPPPLAQASFATLLAFPGKVLTWGSRVEACQPWNFLDSHWGTGAAIAMKCKHALPQASSPSALCPGTLANKGPVKQSREALPHTPVPWRGRTLPQPL